jgi:hypothetical protein
MIVKNAMIPSESRSKRAAAQIAVYSLGVLEPAFRLVYKAFFSWWLSPALHRSALNSWADDIKSGAPFLFRDHQARVIPDPRPEANDSSMGCVYIGTKNLVFKFSEWHHENHYAWVAPAFAPTDLYHVIDALRVADPEGRSTLPRDIENWYDLARILEPRFRLLETAFNEENFENTKRKIQSGKF